MKKGLFFVLLFVVMVGLLFSISYADDSCGPNLTWELSNDGVLTISGTGEMNDLSWGSAPWKNDSSNITRVVIEEGVKNIGASAFSWHRELQSVQLPESLERIDKNAFENCNKLVSCNIPSGLRSIGDWAFYGCNNLASLSLNEGLQSVGELAFCDCDKILTLSIPSSLVSISDDRTFKGCNSLVAINVAEDNPNYCSIDGVLYNKDMSILYCYPAGKPDASYQIPDSVTKINNYGFNWNEHIVSVTIPGSVRDIGGDAFAGCSAVTEFVIPEGVVSIGSTCFFSCDSLNKISLPASLSSFGSDMFESCGRLTSIEVADDSLNYKSVDGVMFNKDGSILMYFPSAKGTSYVIPEGVRNISDYAFLYNKNIVNVVFPDGLETIGQSAFKGCKNLVTIDLPNTLTTIKGGAFASCDGLSVVVIPESVMILGDGAFDWDKNIVSATIKNPMTSFDKYGVFDYCGDALVLSGLAGSTTEAYAKENNITFKAVTFEEEKNDKKDSDLWICSECGAEMDGGKFCYECGAPRPSAQVCENCGYEVEEGKKMKFCPECGTKFE